MGHEDDVISLQMIAPDRQRQGVYVSWRRCGQLKLYVEELRDPLRSIILDKALHEALVLTVGVIDKLYESVSKAKSVEVIRDALMRGVVRRHLRPHIAIIEVIDLCVLQRGGVM